MGEHCIKNSHDNSRSQTTFPWEIANAISMTKQCSFPPGLPDRPEGRETLISRREKTCPHEYRGDRERTIYSPLHLHWLAGRIPGGQVPTAASYHRDNNST